MFGVLCAGLLSCTSSLPVETHLRWQDGPLVPVTAPFIVLGDTQEHEITGLPASVFGGISDRGMTEVTIRPPQQALFGRFLFADLFRPDSDAEPAVIHLGDLLDISCRSELTRYEAILDDVSAARQQKWILVPGNHDGTAHGTLNIVDNDSKFGYGAPGWDYECRVPGSVPDIFKERVDHKQEVFLGRDALLTWYAERKIGALDPAIMDTNSAKSPTKIDWPRLGETSPPGSLIERMVGKIIARDPARQTNYAESFLVQKIILPPARGGTNRVSIIALDTTQFPGHLNAIWQLGSTLSANPGQTGYVLKDQIDAVERLVRAQGDNEILIFAGHHDWASLDYRVKWALAPVFAAAKNPVVYLSAHTHEGFWRRWRVGGRPMLEFNVSSLADWPIAYRTLCVAASEDRRHLRVVAGFAAADPDCRTDRTGSGTPFQASATEDDHASKPLIDMWRANCPNFDTELTAQRSIVHKHREERRKISHLFARLLFGSQAADFSLYRDKLNDLVIAGYALIDAAGRYPGLREVLDGSAPSGPDVRPYRLDDGHIQGEQCRDSPSILACLNRLPGVHNALTDDLQRSELYNSVQLRYRDLARVIAAAQDNMSQINDWSLKRDLACIAAAAAANDAAEQKSSSASAEELDLNSTFYASSGEAVDDDAP